ncbi:MAG: hypothetical protein J6Q15_02095, partial [Clostridia bacterium]|nr:hypothetical protein [Clostridia bacterium]
RLRTMPKPLALYYFGKNQKEGAEVLKRCPSGGGCINEVVMHVAETNLPFGGVGVDKAEAQQLLSSENVLNCYYLNDGTTYDTNYILPIDAVEPKGLSLESFATYSNLNNFSFIIDSSSEQQLNGVWTYSTAVDRNRSTYPLSATALPELTSANAISRSIRVFTDESGANSEIKDYKYPIGYELGSKNNPYIIRSVEEYQSVFIDGASIIDSKRYITGYVRFVDDISFSVEDDYINVDTRSQYMLGDKNDDNKREPAFTLIDGNGMTISDVVINYTEDETGNLGLFSEVYNSVIKGLTITYASQTNDSGNEVGSSKASYVGGVAGIAKDSYFIDINLTGNVTLRAHNVVGGVVGKLTGSNSGLYNIVSNLNVQAGNYTNSVVYTEDAELIYLSYAGGIAGIVDIGVSNNIKSYNVNKLTVNEVSVRADRAGGIAGYFGSNVNAKRLTYTISNTSQIFGHDVAGGIVADNYADIELSQANRDVDTQYEYDKKFAEYINNTEILAIDNSDNAYGNLTAITGDGIVGGFVGVNYNGKISNSLTKANITNNDQYGDGIDVVGGFIGKSYGGNLEYVYAQNFIDLVHTITIGEDYTNSYTSKVVGGIIGEVTYNDTTSNKVGLNNVVGANWFDKTELQLIDTATQKVEYVIGKKSANVELVKSSISDNSSPNIHYGIFNVGDNTTIKDKIVNTNAPTVEYYQMEELYYISTANDEEGRSTQQDVFNTLFAIW